jgi:tetratricopeptide (TPR) repeat protein
MAMLFLVIPAGAESSPLETLGAELSSKASEPGFASLAISKARGLGKLSDSVILISGLLDKSIKAEDTRDLYVELASMQELLGLYEEAARSWEAAVAALPGKGNPLWLLSAAACRLVTGDAEAAGALSKAAMLTTTNGRLVALATLIEARALILAGDLSGALALSREALATESSDLQAAALSIARDASVGVERESYEKRLHAEYPGWPGTNDILATIYGLIHSTSSQSTGGGIALPTTPVSSESAGGNTLVHTPVPPPERPVDKDQDPESKPLYYQLGAFRNEANATLLSSRLARAGFKPKTARKESGTGVLSIVYLEAGSDPGRLMVALKDAGFESWPLFGEP